MVRLWAERVGVTGTVIAQFADFFEHGGAQTHGISQATAKFAGEPSDPGARKVRL
jgi:hypothetical protein